MFGKKKRLEQLEKIEQARKQLKLEKQELLFIKEQLEDSTPKVDVSNIYVWQHQGLFTIVRLDVEKFRGRNWGGLGDEVTGYLSTLTDIFTNNIVYQRSATEKIQRKQYIGGKSIEDGYYAYLLPLHECDRNLLAYTNKKIPLYVLQQLYYKLNNVDVKSLVLTRAKEN